MRGRGGSGTGVVGTTTAATATTTTWDRCCRFCRVAVATAAIRRWTPTVFGYAMLVSLLAAHVLPPVWAATRPTPLPGPRSPHPGAPTPPTDAGGGPDAGGGAGDGGGSGGHAAKGGNGHRRHGSRSAPKSTSGHTAVSQQRVAADPSTRFLSLQSPRPDQCHGWGVHLHRLLLRRSSGVRPHRQHSSSHRHYQHYPAPAPSLTSLASSYSSPPSSSSSISALSPSSTSSHEANNRGLPEAPLQVVIHQQQVRQPRPHHRQQQQQHLHLSLAQAEQREMPVEEELLTDDEGRSKGSPSSSALCEDTEQQVSELPMLCNCSSCKPFNHRDPDDPDSARCRRRSRTSLTEWTMCQICSCTTRYRRLNAVIPTLLPFCSHLPLNYLLPCAATAPSSSSSSSSSDTVEDRADDNVDPACKEGCDGPGQESGCMCSKKDCVTRLHRLLRVDQEVEERFEAFKGLLDRYDCNSNYSVRWRCEHCEDAYKQWLCASALTYFVNGRPVRPCNSFCQQVEATCPFFRPKVETHEGDPSFTCKDPEIERGPGNGGADVISPCFQLCHVMSKADIKRTYCHANDSQCRDLRRELEECPPLRVNSSTHTDNSTGSHANTTSAATGSVHIFCGHVTRMSASSVLVVGAGGVIGGGSDPGAVRLMVATMLWLLWLALTSYPYSCIGLT